MKSNHEYYSLKDLMKRWSEYDLDENLLIRRGAEGIIQFHAIITPPTQNWCIEIICGTKEETDEGVMTPVGSFHAVYIDYRESIILKISPNTLEPFLIPDSDGRARAEFTSSPCEQCQKKYACNREPECSHSYHDIMLRSTTEPIGSGGVSSDTHQNILITEDHLLISHDEVEKIELQEKIEKEKFHSPEQKKEKWQQQVNLVELPDSTSPAKLEIRFKALDAVIISVPGTTIRHERNYESLGFKNNQGKKDSLWNQAWITFHKIATKNGSYSHDDIYEAAGYLDGSSNAKVVQRFKDTLCKINRKLQFSIPILNNESPLKHYRKQKHWRSSFILGLTPAYSLELCDETPNTDDDPDLLEAIHNDHGHILCASTDDRDEHLNKD